MKLSAGVRPLAIVFATAAALLAGAPADAQSQTPVRLGSQDQPQGPETFTATATVKSAAGPTVSVPVVIGITNWTSDADRAKVLAALKTGDSGAAKAALEGLPEAGTIQTDQRTIPLRFARSRGTGSSRVITVVAPQPLIFLGEGGPGAKPKEGYDFAFATFLVDASGKGNAGDLAPAARLGVDANDAVVVEDYGAEAVRLTGIAKK